MAVKPHELDNRERGMVLENRAPDVVGELKALRARLAAAKAAAPQPGDYARGWMSAVRAIEGEG